MSSCSNESAKFEELSVVTKPGSATSSVSSGATDKFWQVKEVIAKR